MQSIEMMPNEMQCTNRICLHSTLIHEQITLLCLLYLSVELGDQLLIHEHCFAFIASNCCWLRCSRCDSLLSFEANQFGSTAYQLYRQWHQIEQTHNHYGDQWWLPNKIGFWCSCWSIRWNATPSISWRWGARYHPHCEQIQIQIQMHQLWEKRGMQQYSMPTKERKMQHINRCLAAKMQKWDDVSMVGGQLTIFFSNRHLDYIWCSILLNWFRRSFFDLLSH